MNLNRAKFIGIKMRFYKIKLLQLLLSVQEEEDEHGIVEVLVGAVLSRNGNVGEPSSDYLGSSLQLETYYYFRRGVKEGERAKG